MVNSPKISSGIYIAHYVLPFLTFLIGLIMGLLLNLDYFKLAVAFLFIGYSIIIFYTGKAIFVTEWNPLHLNTIFSGIGAKMWALIFLVLGIVIFIEIFNK